MKMHQLATTVLLAAALAGGAASAGDSSGRTNARAAQAAKSASVSIAIEKMACSSCAESMKREIEGLAGVKNVEVSLELKGALVEYDPAKVSPEKMVAHIKEVGFDAHVR